MSEEDYELTLFDRLEVIRKIYHDYDLEHKAYISFSGGKDSCVLSALFDEAVPENKIPRVYINTGIEYSAIVDYVRERERDDPRFVEIKPTKPIKQVLETYGYPFKSKEHSVYVMMAMNGSHTKSCQRYFLHVDNGSKKKILCPKKLQYQYKNPPFKISDRCCYKLKKEPAHLWEKEHKRPIAILGLRQGEGGLRARSNGCVLFDGKRNLKKFKPLNPVSKDFENWYIKSRNIKLCKLYYPPFNFERTGCKGCPFNLELQKDLNTMEKLLPNEKKQCEIIWKPVYAEYRRLQYRLYDEQMSLFNEESEKKEK